MPATRILLTGVGAEPIGLREAFEELLLGAEEALLRENTWHVAEDGFEPWLGDIHDAA